MRKKVVVEDSDEEGSPHTAAPENDPDEADHYTPAPSRSPRRRTRQQTADAPSTLRTAARSRKVRNSETVEQSQIFEADPSFPPEPVSPTKNASPRKRKSVAAPRRGRVSGSIDPPPLPTPKPSVTPEPSQLPGTPLADITDTTVNGRNATPDTPREAIAIKPMDTILEKPMDIVIRSRALAVPTPPEPTNPKARTVIKYLILTNFKSYAGRQEVGPFHASFSSVVGPNGSGKSNVIDSLLFVFGFRASKMRQGKISALIHNSAAFPNLDFCEVEVHFEEVMDLVRHSN